MGPPYWALARVLGALLASSQGSPAALSASLVGGLTASFKSFNNIYTIYPRNSTSRF